MQTGFQATKDLGDPAGIFMGERKYFFAFWHDPTTVISFLSISIFLGHPRQFSRTCVILKCELFGWFTLVYTFVNIAYDCWLVYPCGEFSMMLNISHSPLHIPLEILETDTKGENHCQNEKILALVVPHNKRNYFLNCLLLDFHTVILLLLQMIFGW